VRPETASLKAVRSYYLGFTEYWDGLVIIIVIAVCSGVTDFSSPQRLHHPSLTLGIEPHPGHSATMAGLEEPKSKQDAVKEESPGIKMERKDSSSREVLNSISAVSIKDEAGMNGTASPSKRTSTKSSASPAQSQSPVSSPLEKIEKEEIEEKVGGEITVKMEPGQPPKLSRTSSKIVPRAAPLFDHYEDKTMEAMSTFQVMESCTYTNKYMGYTEHAMECDCTEEWGKSSILRSTFGIYRGQRTNFS
jgi:hypothetical protein